MSACAMASTERVGEEPVSDAAPVAIADHCAHVAAFVRHEHLRRQA
jgi:hypothetical protein